MALERLADGSTQLKDDECTFTFTRLRPGTLVVRIEGKDSGQFGTLPIDQFREEMQRFGELTLLIDARNGEVRAQNVIEVWGGFFKSNRLNLKSLHVLVGSKFMELTVGITTHLARMGRMVTVTTDAEAFERAVEKARASD
ncbi:MAG: hypothetical protein ACRDKT_07195 [Actinomycetota bacterium]